MSATSGRDVILNGKLASNLDANSKKILNADLSDSSNTLPTTNVPTILHTTGILKGDGAGNATEATPLQDYWDGTVVFTGANSSKGLVPNPGANGDATYFLSRDCTWKVPAGTADVPTIEETTGILKGDDNGNAVEAVADTDYWSTTTFAGDGTIGLVPDPEEVSTDKFLNASGEWAVPPASVGVTIESTSAVIKGDGAGGGVAATPGTDYVAPSTALTRLTAATVVLSTTTPAINWNSSTSFSWTLAGNSSPTFSNNTNGWDITVAITNTVLNYTVTWPTGIKWQGGSQPTQTTGAKTDIWTFKQFGSVIYGAVHPNHS